MRSNSRSGFGKDLFGAWGDDPIDGSRADETSVVGDLILGSSARGAPWAVGDEPVDCESVSDEVPFSVNDGPGHDPLDEEIVGAVRGGDRHAPAVLGPVGIDPVHDVGPEDPRALI